MRRDGVVDEFRIGRHARVIEDRNELGLVDGCFVDQQRAQLGVAVLCAVSGALVFSCSLFPLVSFLGPLGVILAAGAGMVAWALASIFFVARLQGLDFGHALVRPIATLVCAMLAYWACGSLGGWAAWLMSMASLLAASMFFGIVRPAERAAIFEVLRFRQTNANEDPAP